MQFITFAITAVLLGAVQGQTITATSVPNASQLSKLASDGSVLETDATWQSQTSVLASYASSLAAAGSPVPQVTVDIKPGVTANWPSFISAVNAAATGTTEFPGASTEVVQAYNGIGRALASIVNKDVTGAACGLGVDHGVVMTGLALTGTVFVALML